MARSYVLLVLDCVRKDYFDNHAKRLRNKSDISFEQCRAASSWSPPSHGSIFTGDLPSKHGVHKYNNDFSTLNEEDLIFTYIPDHTTHAVNGNPCIGSRNIDQIFDTYSEEIWYNKNQSLEFMYDGMYPGDIDSTEEKLRNYLNYLQECFKHEHTSKSLIRGVYYQLIRERLRSAPIPRLNDDGASKIKDRSLQKIQQSTEPFFLFVNFLDAHHTYKNIRHYDQSLTKGVKNTWESDMSSDFSVLFNQDTSGFENYIENRRKTYAASIEYLDRIVIKFIEEAQKLTNDEITFIITADHGENLGYSDENYMIHHNSSMSESLLHVPLEIINPPEGCFSTEISEFISHLSLGKLIDSFERQTTNENIFTDSIPAERIGTVFFDEFKRLSNTAESYDLSNKDIVDEWEYFDRLIRCVYHNGEKYQWNSLGESQLYEINTKPHSQQELTESGIDIPEFVKNHFDTEINETKKLTRDSSEFREKEIDASTKAQLEGLGYI